MPPCAVKTCAVRPVFARVVWELRAADPSKCPRAHEARCWPREQPEAPRRRWKPGQAQHPEPKNQDGQHMLNQPRGSFPDSGDHSAVARVRLQLGLSGPATWVIWARSGPKWQKEFEMSSKGACRPHCIQKGPHGVEKESKLTTFQLFGLFFDCLDFLGTGPRGPRN